MPCANGEPKKPFYILHPTLEKFPLLLQTEFFDERIVAALVFALQILQMRAAVGHHLQKAAAAVLVLQMLLEVHRQLVNLFRQKRNLNLRATGVRGVYGHFFDRFSLFLLGKHGTHSITVH